MAKQVKAIPDGYHSITPYLIVDQGADAIAFYKQVFGAVELLRLQMPNGKIGHAELQIGTSRIMLADEHPEMGARGPKSVGGSPVTLHLYLEDVDAAARRLMDAGATELRPVKDQFYGDRSGGFTDPFGHIWHIATHMEDIEPEELNRRAEAAMKEMSGS